MQTNNLYQIEIVTWNHIVISIRNTWNHKTMSKLCVFDRNYSIKKSLETPKQKENVKCKSKCTMNAILLSLYLRINLDELMCR